MIRTKTLGVAVLFAGVVTAPFATAWAGAQAAPSSFTATSEARGFQLRVVEEAPLTETLFDGGGPTAQAALDSFGSSTAYAAMPDGGSFLPTLPATAAGLILAGAPEPPLALPAVPDYPLAAQSDGFTNPSSQVGEGPFTLRAESSEERSVGHVVIGSSSEGTGSQLNVDAIASVEIATDRVLSSAQSQVTGLSIGPLTISQVTSEAAMTLGPDGELVATSRMDIEGAEVGGTAVVITPEGIELADNAAPLPIGSSIDSLLASSGMTVTMSPNAETDTSISTGTIEISVPIEPIEVDGVGRVAGRMVALFGGASASMQPGGAGGFGGPATPQPTPQPASDAAAPAVAPSVGAVAPIPSAPATSPTPAPAGGAPDSSAALTPVAAELSAIPLFNIRAAYVMLVLGAVALVAMNRSIHRRASTSSIQEHFS